MQKVFLGVIMMGAALWSGSFSWEESVRVTRSKPVYRMETIREPYQVCRDEKVPVSENNYAVPVAVIAGSVTGGVLGHQIGKGRGQDAATVGGVLLGAVAGANLVQQNRQITYRTRRVCETRYKTRQERRLVHYKNIAWYRGHKIVKHSSRPLKRIRLTLTASY